MKHVFPCLSALISLTSDRLTPSLNAHMRTQPHTHVQIKHPCLPLFICTTSVILSHTRIHTQGLEAALSPDSHAPPDSTNQDKLQPCPHLPPPKPALSYPPLIFAATRLSPSVLLGPLRLLGRTGSHCNWFRHNLLATW